MEIKVKKGVVELRLPNFAESWRVRSAIGLAPANHEPSAWTTYRLSECLSDFIDVSQVKDCDSVDDFINDPKNSKVVQDMIGKIALRVMEFSGEKKS